MTEENELARETNIWGCTYGTFKNRVYKGALTNKQEKKKKKQETQEDNITYYTLHRQEKSKVRSRRRNRKSKNLKRK